MRRNTLIFDLDGTIAHTAPDLVGTLNRIVAPHGVAAVDIRQVGQIVGHGAKAMIKQAFDLQDISLNAELHDRLFSDFIDDYAANIANETHVFDGLVDALQSLQAKGFTFCVCTNKMEGLAVQLLGKLGLLDWFPAITGGDTFDFRKPDPRHLAETLGLMNAELDQAIMIGDSATDINAARNAGIPSVAVTFGYSDLPVKELGASAIISDFLQLPDTVENLSR